MSGIKLDLAKFKHLKSDDKSTTLKHADGHELTLHHSKLDKMAQQQLSALSKIGKEAQTSDQKQEAQAIEQKNKMATGGEIKDAPHGSAGNPTSRPDKGWGAVIVKDAEGGEVVQQYAEGTPDEPVQNLTPDQAEWLDPKAGGVGEFLDPINPATIAHKLPSADSVVKGMQMPQIPGQLSQNGSVVPGKDMDTGVAFVPKQEPQTPVETPSGKYISPENVKVETPEEKSQREVQEQQVKAGAPKGSGGGYGLSSDPEAAFAQGYQSRITGINREADALGKLGEQQSILYQKQIESQAKAKSAYDEQYHQLEAERQSLMHDIQNNHVDPEKYWDNHSKLATGIGMILAGFNPTNNPNAAINFLKSQMEMNLQSQMKNLGAKENLLSANLRQFGNLKDATDMTRIMQSDIVHNQLLQAASTAQSPLAKAAAMKAAGQLQMEAAPMLQQFAMRKAMMNLANGSESQNPQAIEQMLGYMRVMNPEMAKDMAARYIPGYGGLSPIHIPEKQREALQSHAALDTAAKDLLGFMESHKGSFNPSEMAQGAIKVQHLQALVREGLLGTVYREGEQPLLDKIVGSNPTSVFNEFRNIPKTKELINLNQMMQNTLAGQYKLKAPQQAPEIQYKTVHGVKYMRGPNGQAIPVK